MIEINNPSYFDRFSVRRWIGGVSDNPIFLKIICLLGGIIGFIVISVFDNIRGEKILNSSLDKIDETLSIWKIAHLRAWTTRFINNKDESIINKERLTAQALLFGDEKELCDFVSNIRAAIQKKYWIQFNQDLQSESQEDWANTFGSPYNILY